MPWRWTHAKLIFRPKEGFKEELHGCAVLQNINISFSIQPFSRSKYRTANFFFSFAVSQVPFCSPSKVFNKKKRNNKKKKKKAFERKTIADIMYSNVLMNNSAKGLSTFGVVINVEYKTYGRPRGI